MSDTTTTTYDFGAGPIPAHRHTNPDGTKGGWVADSATVAGTVYLHVDGKIGADARVGDRAHVGAWARVGAWAHVGDGADLGKESPPQAVIGRFVALCSSRACVTVGCQQHPLDYWHEHIDSIGLEAGATEWEVAATRHFLSLCEDWCAMREAEQADEKGGAA